MRPRVFPAEEYPRLPASSLPARKTLFHKAKLLILDFVRNDKELSGTGRNVVTLAELEDAR